MVISDHSHAFAGHINNMLLEGWSRSPREAKEFVAFKNELDMIGVR